MIESGGRGGGALWSSSLENKYLYQLVCSALDFSQKKKIPNRISKDLSVPVTRERSHADLTSVTEITELERFQASCP